MMENRPIDITFDVRKDSTGPDPDKRSKTLKRYHKLLWSKKLPNGKLFSLEYEKGKYLYHKSGQKEYHLSSDCIIHTYSNGEYYRQEDFQPIIKQIPKEEIEQFLYIANTIGGRIIFPRNRIKLISPGNRAKLSQTINMARGWKKYNINDRFDLTLECIRRYYNDEDSPLIEIFKLYDDFFSLFLDFKGYCEFFFLQDLTTDDYLKVNFFLPFNGFIINPLPKDVDEYQDYMKNSIEFLHKRNKRIDEYNNELCK